MVMAGLVAEGVGIDYSDGLLQEAWRAAEALDLPLAYHQMNVNTAAFPRRSSISSSITLPRTTSP